MTSTSPTLQGQEGYLSLILPLPAALSRRIRAWRQAQGAEGQLAQASHITLLILEEQAAPADPLALLADRLAGRGPLKISLGAPLSFEPTTPVTYLPVEEGRAELEALHGVCQELLGPSASPFPYVPHVTLAHDLGREALDESLTFFADLPADEVSFSVSDLLVYRLRAGTWQPLGRVGLA